MQKVRFLQMDLSYQSTEQSIFHELKEAVILIDKQGRIVYYNQQASTLAKGQNNPGLALDAHILDVFPKRELMRVLQTKKAEIRKLFRLSEHISVLVSRFPLLNKDGEVLGAAAIIQQGSDGEDDWRVGEYIQQGMQAVLQNTSQAFVILDEHRLVIMQNPAYEKFLLLLKNNSSAEADWKEQLENVSKKTMQTRRTVEQKVEGSPIEGNIRCIPNLIDGIWKGCILFVDYDMEQAELIKQLEQSRRIIRALEAQSRFDDFTAESSRMRMAVQQGKIAADMDYIVFLRGPAGTGKKMFANAIHNEGKRKYQAFSVIDCLQEKEKVTAFLEMLNSEDTSRHPQGTVYLKSITDLSIEQQKKLYRICTNHYDTAGYRLVVSSSVNVETAMMEGLFLQDLYYYLLQTSIHLPALRERKEDVPLLVHEWIQIGNKEHSSCVSSVDQAALETLQNFPYQHNFKELQAVINYSLAKLNREKTTLYEADLAFATSTIDSNQKASIPHNEDKPLSELVEEYEKVIIERTLKELDGNKTLTAKKLGLSVRNLYYKLEKYHLN